MAAHPIRESYFADDANPALRLLPAGTEWCIERTELGGDAAIRSREAALPRGVIARSPQG